MPSILILWLISGGSPPDYYASGPGHPHSSYVAQYAQAASSYGAVSYGYTGQETKWSYRGATKYNLLTPHDRPRWDTI